MRELRGKMRDIDDGLRAAALHPSDPRSLRVKRVEGLGDRIRGIVGEAERLERDVPRLQQHLIEAMRIDGLGSPAEQGARFALDRYVVRAMGWKAPWPEIKAAVAGIRGWAESRERQITDWIAGGWAPPTWRPTGSGGLPLPDNSWWRERP